MNVIVCILLSVSVASVEALDMDMDMDDDPAQSMGGISLTPPDYMRRRRPTAAMFEPAPKILNCSDDLPPPTNISVAVQISDISSVNNGQVTMSLYLRYSWEEYRFSNISQISTDEYIEVAATIKNKLWLPDLYFPSAATVISPVVFVPSTSFRIYKNRTVYANQYMIIELSCPFNYRYFPIDSQLCDIIVMSFGYSPCEIKLEWSQYEPLIYAESKLTQFSYYLLLPDAISAETHWDDLTGPLERSQIHMHLVLERKALFYLMQIYIPSALFVVVAWISFLVPVEMLQGRMLLTITTMLTLVELFAAGSEYVPLASYVKAVDVWMCVCTFLTFYAVVDCLVDVYLHGRASGRDDNAGTFVLTGQARRQTVMEIFRKNAYSEQHAAAPTEASEADFSPEDGPADELHSIAGGAGDPDDPDEPDRSGTSIRDLARRAVRQEKKSVIVYPVFFAVFNVVYWTVCLGAWSPVITKGAMGIEIQK